MRLHYLGLAALLAVPTVSGCGTIIHGTRQKLQMTSQPAGASVYSGTELLGQTPTVLNLKRDREHQLTLRLDGYRDVVVNIERELDFAPAVVGNLFSWGIFGFAVDFVNGAAYKLDPSQVTAMMEASSTGAIQPRNGGVHVVFYTADQVAQVLGPEALAEAELLP